MAEVAEVAEVVERQRRRKDMLFLVAKIILYLPFNEGYCSSLIVPLYLLY